MEKYCNLNFKNSISGLRGTTEFLNVFSDLLKYILPYTCDPSVATQTQKKETRKGFEEAGNKMTTHRHFFIFVLYSFEIYCNFMYDTYVHL